MDNQTFNIPRMRYPRRGTFTEQGMSKVSRNTALPFGSSNVVLSPHSFQPQVHSTGSYLVMIHDPSHSRLHLVFIPSRVCGYSALGSPIVRSRIHQLALQGDSCLSSEELD